MERYAVQNVGSMEFLSDWLGTEEQAQAVAAECEQHETQPDCRIVRFSEWAPGKRLSSIAGQAWDGQYPVVYDNGNGVWLLTGEIVSAQETDYTVTDCGDGMYAAERG
jgi:hypothetical protein